MMQPQKMGMIGLGRMGRCLAEGLKRPLLFSVRHPQNLAADTINPQWTLVRTNSELAENASILILAVKPQNVSTILKEIGPKLDKTKTLISIAASVSTEAIEKQIPPHVPVIRAMPNTPAMVGEGITALALGKAAGPENIKIAQEIFQSVGRTVVLDEKHLDAVTGLSGCGPAYLYVVLESLTDAGIKVGLPREIAKDLATQTVLGAAKMLQKTGKHPAALKDEVTTPAGCTIDGLMELEEGKLRVTLIKAVVRATERAKALSTREETK